MELYKILLRVLFAYVFLHAILRLSGKRTVAEGRTFDLVAALTLGDMVDDLLWGEVPAAQFVVAAGVLVSAQVLVSAGACLSRGFAWLVEGEPRRFLRGGSLIEPALRRERVNLREVKEMLRLCGLPWARRAEVKSAWINNNGEPAMVYREWAEPTERRDRERLKGVAR